MVAAATKQIQQKHDSGPLSFSDDVLRVEHHGPACQQPLTLVDLPGLIHSKGRQQNEHDKNLVWKLVEDYMKSPESIILAVVAADNNHVNQAVLDLARKHDKDGKRTLGVITKPDKLDAGSASQDNILALARNEEHFFELGWHLLRNRGFELQSSSAEERDSAEEEFFKTVPWCNLSPKSLGIKELRSRLSNILYKKTVSSLPEVLGNIESLIKGDEMYLTSLGKPRPDRALKQAFIVDISVNFGLLLKSALSGEYSDPFFRDSEGDREYVKRLRAAVENLNKEFADKMRNEGHTYRDLVDSAEQYSSEGSTPNNRPKQSREHYADYVNALVTKNSGRELPGIANKYIICDLFREQSKNWEKIATDHVNAVWNVVMAFVELPLERTDTYTSQRVLDWIIQPAMEKKRELLEQKVQELLLPYTTDLPMTYNNRFLRALEHYRQQRKGSSGPKDEFEGDRDDNKENRRHHGHIGDPDPALVEEVCDITAIYYTVRRQEILLVEFC